MALPAISPTLDREGLMVALRTFCSRAQDVSDMAQDMEGCSDTKDASNASVLCKDDPDDTAWFEDSEEHVADLCRNMQVVREGFRSTRRRYAVHQAEVEEEAFQKLRQCLRDTQSSFAEERAQAEIEKQHLRAMLRDARERNVMAADVAADHARTGGDSERKLARAQGTIKELLRRSVQSAARLLARILRQQAQTSSRGALRTWQAGMYACHRLQTEQLQDQVRALEALLDNPGLLENTARTDDGQNGAPLNRLARQRAQLGKQGLALRARMSAYSQHQRRGEKPRV